MQQKYTFELTIIGNVKWIELDEFLAINIFYKFIIFRFN